MLSLFSKSKSQKNVPRSPDPLFCPLSAQNSYHETDFGVYTTDVYVGFKFERNLGQSPCRKEEDGKLRNGQENEVKKNETF